MNSRQIAEIILENWNHRALITPDFGFSKHVSGKRPSCVILSSEVWFQHPRCSVVSFFKSMNLFPRSAHTHTRGGAKARGDGWRMRTSLRVCNDSYLYPQGHAFHSWLWNARVRTTPNASPERSADRPACVCAPCPLLFTSGGPR